MQNLHPAIQLLRASDQRLVFLDAIITPIYKLATGIDDRLQLAKALRDQGVIESYSGYMSLAQRPVKLFVTTFVLTKDFFETCYGRWKGRQMELF